MHDDRARVRREIADRREIPREIVVELPVETHADRVRRSGHEQRVSVRRRARRELRTDMPAGARAIVDEHRLAPAFGELLTHESREQIRRPTRREWGDDADALAWIILRRRD